MKDIEFTDRYEALGIPYPDEETVCQGHCEGTGWIPVKLEYNPEYTKQWIKTHNRAHSVKGILKDSFDFLIMGKPWWAISHLFTGWKCDGWHFIKCPDCKGTGRVK